MSDIYIWRLYVPFIFWRLYWTFIFDIYILHLYLTFVFDIHVLSSTFDMYIWHLYLTVIFDVYVWFNIWRLYLTFVFDMYIWHLDHFGFGIWIWDNQMKITFGRQRRKTCKYILVVISCCFWLWDLNRDFLPNFPLFAHSTKSVKKFQGYVKVAMWLFARSTF